VWDVALQLLKEAESGDVLQPHIHYLRGLIFMQQGMIQDSLAALRQAIYCDPNFALAHYSLGEAYEKVGAVEDARRYWLRARRTLAGLDSQQPLPYTDDLTVEMLNGLLDYQLNKRY
jgi:tetratricopeptide (TPR) repeat protein